MNEEVFTMNEEVFTMNEEVFGEFRKVRKWLERHQIEFAAEHLDYFGGYRLLAFTQPERFLSSVTKAATVFRTVCSSSGVRKKWRSRKAGRQPKM